MSPKYVINIRLPRYLSGDDDTCRGKKGTGGVHLTKSNTSEIGLGSTVHGNQLPIYHKAEFTLQFDFRSTLDRGSSHTFQIFSALVVGIYGDSIQPQQAATAVEGIADHLKKSNY